MKKAQELVELGRRARNEGRTEEALEFYVEATRAFQEENAGANAEHARRHVADLQRELGQIEEARKSIGSVLAFYRANGTGTLELGNTLRISALLEDAAGRREAAQALWSETLGLYEQVGVEAGVAECRRRLS